MTLSGHHCYLMACCMVLCTYTIKAQCVPSGATCICPMIYAPVCGCDGVMYSNSCMANCQGVTHTPPVPNWSGGFLPCASPVTPSWNCISGIAGWTCVDPGTGNGTYSSLAACQSACVPPPSWDCINGACSDPGTGVGIYSSLTDCNQTCGVSTIEEHTTTKTLLKITDILGRKTNQTRNKLLFYIYDDGTVEKKIILE